MPRIRSIKPETPEDESLGACSRDARLTFILLWTQADDQGRFRASPALVRAQLFPYDDDITAGDVAKWLGELADKSRVQLYEADGQRYGHITNWTKHQRIDNAGKSSFPPPPDTPSPPPADTLGDSPQPSANGGGSLLDGKGGDRKGKEGNTCPAESESNALVLVADVVPQAAPVPLDPVAQVFNAWVDATGRTGRTRLDAKRRKLIKAALADYPLEDVTDAVRGWRHSPHHRGENANRTVYNDLNVLLRDAAQIEKFRDLERNAGPQRPNVPKSWGAIDRALQRRTAAREASNQ